MAEAEQPQQAPQQGNPSLLDEAKSLLVQGKRFMALDDYQSATDCLEQSCQLYDAYYGVAKLECADAYLEYGLALVALANLEAGSGTEKIMKKAGIDGEDEEDDDADEEDGEEGEDEEEEEDEAESPKEGEGNGTDEKVENGTSEEKKDSNGQIPMDTSHENGSKVAANGQSSVASSSGPSTSAAKEDPQPGTSGGKVAGDDGEDVDNEEATTMEIAWEVLCLAKRLFMTDESLEGRLKLAETLQKLGEISIEWDNNDNAVSILEECLKVRSAILRPDDRLIAFTYYNLGLAHSFKSETQQANDNFQKAINVIEKRIESLSEDLDKAKQAQDTVAIGAYQKEINELKELLPDMTMRIDDSKEDSAQSTEVLKRTREEMQQEDEEVKKVCLDKSKPVDDISHLVKRKT